MNPATHIAVHHTHMEGPRPVEVHVGHGSPHARRPPVWLSIGDVTLFFDDPHTVLRVALDLEDAARSLLEWVADQPAPNVDADPIGHIEVASRLGRL